MQGVVVCARMRSELRIRYDVSVCPVFRLWQHPDGCVVFCLIHSLLLKTYRCILYNPVVRSPHARDFAFCFRTLFSPVCACTHLVKVATHRFYAARALSFIALYCVARRRSVKMRRGFDAAGHLVLAAAMRW
eukprot:3836863-Pleurochrysis_carterae.AAC.1